MQIDVEAVLEVDRLAVRKDGKWQWFGDAVYTTFGQVFAYVRKGVMMPAMAVLELECQRAVQQYALDDIKIIRAPSEHAMSLVDLNEDV